MLRHVSLLLFPRSTPGVARCGRGLACPQVSPAQPAGPAGVPGIHGSPPAGKQLSPRRRAHRDAGSRPDASSSVSPMATPTKAIHPAAAANPPSPATGRGHGARARVEPIGKPSQMEGKRLTSVTSQNWRGACPLPPPAPPGPAHSPPRSQSEGERLTSAPWGAGQGGGRARQGRGVGWPGRSCGAPGCCVVLRERTRTEGCGRHPGQTAAGAPLGPVRILVRRCRAARGRQGGEVEGARGERPRAEGRPGARRAPVATSRRGSRGPPAVARACLPRLPADTLGPLVAEPTARGGSCLEVCGSGRRVGPGGPEDAECLWARCAGCMERPRGSRPGSRSPAPGAGMPPRWPGGFVWFLLLPSPFSPLRSLLPSQPIHWAAGRPRPSSVPASPPPPPPLMSISALLSMGRCCCRCCCPRGLWMLSAPCCDDRRMCVCPGPRRIGRYS